jgi:protein TonB
MTLIPLLSAIAASLRAAPVPATAQGGFARDSYNPGAGHRPVAAALAIGLPAALVVAVILSPMVVEKGPTYDPMIGTLITLPKPPPPPEPVQDKVPQPLQQQQATAFDRLVETPPLTGNRADAGPLLLDPPIADPGPSIVPTADPPAPPKLVLAQLDSRFAGAFQPDYPASEQRREVEGVVRVRVLIGADGRVKAVELISSDSPGFFAATKQRALSKWRFKPATRGGVAEESWKEMVVRFQLQNA